MMVSLLVAMDLKRGIGLRGAIPWHLPTDLKRFKRLTMGHHIIMGRKTLTSIGRILPGRISVVLSRRPETLPEGCLGVTSLREALALAEKDHETEAFVIGGGQIFAQAMRYAERIYLTTVQGTFECDVRFPEFDEAKWQAIYQEEIPKSEVDPYASNYRILERIDSSPKVGVNT